LRNHKVPCNAGIACSFLVWAHLRTSG
jgi:hypothetical protein